VPAFEHDGFSLYETVAIARYIDRVFPGPSLQPTDPKQAARMDQIIAVIDSYAYSSIVGKLVWQRLVVPMQGGQGDESIVQGSMEMVKLCLSEFERLKGSNAFLAGSEISLADCFLAPIFAYLTMTPDAEGLLQSAPGLAAVVGDHERAPLHAEDPAPVLTLLGTLQSREAVQTSWLNLLQSNSSELMASARVMPLVRRSPP
jgi:glutathione S-transferase